MTARDLPGFTADHEKYEAKYPKAADYLNTDRDELLEFYHFPAEHLMPPFFYRWSNRDDGTRSRHASRCMWWPPLPYTCLGEAPIEFGELLSGLVSLFPDIGFLMQRL